MIASAVGSVNNANKLPVMLDFDNFSGDEWRPDDIRRLSSWPNSSRVAFVRSLWYMMRMYNPRATVSMPMSKAAGGGWAQFTQPQSQCWSRGVDGLYFGAYSCGIVNATVSLFNGPEHPTVDQLIAAVDPHHFGAALQSPDLTAVWGYKTVLARDFGSVAEYQAAVSSLPELVLGARGARCDLAHRLAASTEFQNTACAKDAACVSKRLEDFLCIGVSECKAATLSQMCNKADSLSLFGNAALMDPAWCLGC